MDHVIAPVADWAVASRPLHPDLPSGDACLLLALPGAALVAVVDGLGHGPEAATAADRAVSVLRECASRNPLDAVMRCHDGLRGTRGVVLGAAWFEAERNTVTWLGVGNVEGVIQRARPGADPPMEFLLSDAGIVGRRLPRLHARIVALAPGDTLLLATDGIDRRFSREPTASDPPGLAAGRILAEYSRPGEDSMVAVVRYRGAAS